MVQLAAIGVALTLLVIAGCTDDKTKSETLPAPKTVPQSSAYLKPGQQLFRERCASCHPDGGNIINPRKTLHSGVMADHGIKTPADVVNIIRHPGPGMTSFAPATLPDAEAHLIAEYILAEFK
jgi:cytochrome c6